MNLSTAKRLVALGALTLSTTSCTQNAGNATTPTNQSLFLPHLSGNWIGNATLTAITPVVEGECVVPAFEQRVIGQPYGNETVTLALTHDGNSLGARLGSATTGLACSYKGTTDLNTLALDAATCDAPELLLRCTNGAVRTMEVIGSTIQGTVVGGRLTGTLANAYNVTDPKTTRVTLHYNISVARP